MEEASPPLPLFEKVRVPPHRLKPLKKEWTNIYHLVFNEMNTNIRMNLKTSCVELKPRPEDHDSTIHGSNQSHNRLKRCKDFVSAVILGFSVDDASTFLKTDDTDGVCLSSFELKHEYSFVECCKQTISDIERSTRTSIVKEENKFHILGRFSDAMAARDAIVREIVESSTGVVHPKPSIISKL